MDGMISGRAIGDAIADELEVMADRPRKVVALSRDPILGAFKLFGATSLFLASRKVGDGWSWVRAGGFGAAIALGVSGLSDMLGVDREETT